MFRQIKNQNEFLGIKNEFPTNNKMHSEYALTPSVLMYPLRVHRNKFHHPQTCGQLAFVNNSISELKEFQSQENDVCHTVVFGKVATVVKSWKMLHWT